jgi:hypothetical protein
MKEVKLSWLDSAFVTASGSLRRSTKQRTVSGQSPARPRQHPLRNPPEPSDEVNAREKKRPERQQRAVLRTDLPIQRMTARLERMTKYNFLVIVSSFQLFLVDASIPFVGMCAKERVKEMQRGAIAANPERK